jgi:hypothetical protein
MKANEFKEVIRQLVIEEVKKEVSKQLPKLLFEMLGQQAKPVIRESSPISQTIPQQKRPIDEEIAPKFQKLPGTIPAAPRPMKKYSSNPVLNQILNETTPGLPSMSEGIPLPGLENGGFEKIGGGVSDEFKAEMRQLMSEGVEMPEPIQEQVEESSGPDLSKLFNKDFKAILNKSKERGVGGGNFSNIIQEW